MGDHVRDVDDGFPRKNLKKMSFKGSVFTHLKVIASEARYVSGHDGFHKLGPVVKAPDRLDDRRRDVRETYR